MGDEPPSARLLNACGTECVAMGKRDHDASWNATYRANDSWETTAPVGSFLEGKSPFGVLDMAGNVEEWTADVYGSYASARAASPRDAIANQGRVTRGGGWGGGRLRAASRYEVDPSDRYPWLGFRCAREARD